MSIPASLAETAEVRTMKLAFYGAGSMAEAIVRGMLNQGLTVPGQIAMINRQNTERLQELHKRYGILTPTSEEQKLRSLEQADIIFLAMKPKDAAEAIMKLQGVVNKQQLLISVIAGLSISTILRLVDAELPVVRTMPNTSSTIGLGATGISFSPAVTEQQQYFTSQIFESVGITAIVDEPLLDTVTGVSGSGPAYVYYFMEAMTDAAVALGLTPDAAKQLTLQTVLGAATMVRETGEAPSELRRKVTSPGGTTQAAIEKLDERQFTQSILEAIHRSKERAAELGEMIERSTLK